MGGTVRVPESERELRTLGEIANAFGATCVQSVGGVPVSSSRYNVHVHVLLFVLTELYQLVLI